MTGRELTQKTDGLLNAIANIMLIFPRRIRLSMLRHSSRMGGGKIAIAWRYILLKRLAKSCGKNVCIKQFVILENVQELEVGNNVSVHPFCYLDAGGGLKIGNDVSIAHNTSILTLNHRWEDMSKPIKYNPMESLPVEIENDVWLGCGVRIMAGVTIHARSVIAAGAVVTKDVESGTLVGGVPARMIKLIV